MEERKDCVIALITSYNPDEGLEQLVLSILKENIISKVLIYDNNSGITGKSVLGNIEKYTDRIIVHYSATNDGLGTAYNTLIKGTSKNTSRASRASNLSLIYSLFLVNFCL